jgi:hypothetical protein
MWRFETSTVMSNMCLRSILLTPLNNAYRLYAQICLHVAC